MLQTFAPRRAILAGLALLCVVAGLPATGAPAASVQTIETLDLSKPFATHSAWRFVVTQGPPVPDDVYNEETDPGAVSVCLRPAAGVACAAVAVARPIVPDADIVDAGDPTAWAPHFLNTAEIVYPHGKTAAPLLLLQTSSEPSGDGDQVIYTQLFAYRRASDDFQRAYVHITGHNENQEVRFVTDGPLRGDVISVEPTQNAPFGFWVTVNQLTPAYTYKQVLRYRSATHYGDGNPLAVIDSEMANTQQRLGLWRPGTPLPLPPAKPCPTPRLVGMELWCQAPQRAMD